MIVASMPTGACAGQVREVRSVGGDMLCVWIPRKILRLCGRLEFVETQGQRTPSLANRAQRAGDALSSITKVSEDVVVVRRR